MGSLRDRISAAERVLNTVKPPAGIWVKFVDPPYGGLPTRWREMSTGEERDLAPEGATCFIVRYGDSEGR